MKLNTSDKVIITMLDNPDIASAMRSIRNPVRSIAYATEYLSQALDDRLKN